QPDFHTRTAATTQSGMNGPTAVAFDVNGSRIFVADLDNKRVLVFSGASLSNGMNANTVLGQTSFTAGSANAGGGATVSQAGLNLPYGVTYDGTRNRLFVSDFSNNRVLVFSGAALSNGMNANTVLGQP